MRNLNRLTNAASTDQARRDYAWLLNLAAEHDAADLIPSAGARPGHRAFDRAAKVGVENLLRERPELSDKLRGVYPGFVENIEREESPLVRPEGPCVELENADGTIWKL